jgi:superfamily II DNA or RNA helicase
LNNLIFAHPAKSRIRVLQTLGRGLRKMKLKTHLMVFDIADDLIDSVENTTLLHMKERRAIYEEEEFPFQEYNISLK